MRNVITTNSTADVSEEYAEAVEALIQGGVALRETTQDNEHGATDFFVRLYAYQAPGSGEERWAVDYSDPASRELEEYDTEAEADARYEEFVRESSDNLESEVDRDGIRKRFSTTDVENVYGPLPELPALSVDVLVQVIDAPAEEPVLVLERSEEGTGNSLELTVGPAAHYPHTQVIVTREELLETLDRFDADAEHLVTGKALNDSDRQELHLLINTELETKVHLIADGLFEPDPV
jgi:hypothetical protein